MSLYHGETSRTLYTRIKEHLQKEQDARGGKEEKETKKALLKHTEAFQPGKEPNFNIKIFGFFKEPLARQINEDV